MIPNPTKSDKVFGNFLRFWLNRIVKRRIVSNELLSENGTLCAGSIRFFFPFTLYVLYTTKVSRIYCDCWVETVIFAKWNFRRNTCWTCYKVIKDVIVSMGVIKKLANRKNLSTSPDRTLISYVFRRRRNFPIIQFSRKVISVMYDTFRVPFCPFG